MAQRQLCTEATVTTILKTAVCKWVILKCPISHVLNFRGWVKLINDKITLIYCVENGFNQTSEFRILKTGCFKMPHLQTPCLQRAVFQMGITIASDLWSLEWWTLLLFCKMPYFENFRFKSGSFQNRNYSCLSE